MLQFSLDLASLNYIPIEAGLKHKKMLDLAKWRNFFLHFYSKFSSSKKYKISLAQFRLSLEANGKLDLVLDVMLYFS